MAGWGNFFGGIGELLGKGATYIPGYVEKLRNEKERLEVERRNIEILNLDINKEEDRKKAVRLGTIRNRLITIDKLLANKAKD